MPPPPEPELQRHARALRQLARVLVGEAHADDLLQDAAVQALAAATPPLRSPGGFLRRVLIRLAGKHHRGERRRRAREAQVAPMPPPEPPDWIAAHREEVRRLDAALLDLPEPLLGTLLLRFFEDLPPSAIAARMGAPVPTVRSRIARGLELLRERLAADGNRDWRAGLVAAFGLPALAPAGAHAVPLAAGLGTLLMGSGTKVLFGAAAAAAVAALFLLLRPSAAEPPSPSTTANVPPARADAVPAPPADAQRIATADTTVAEPGRGALEQRATIRGRLVDPRQQPVAGATADLTGWGGDNRRMQAWLADHPQPEPLRARATTPADGTFALHFAPPPPFQFHLRLIATAHATIDARWHELQPGADVDLGDIVLPPGTLLRGRVVDADGRPVADAQVRVARAAVTEGLLRPLDDVTAATDRDGRFACHCALAAGDYRLKVRQRELLSPESLQLDGAPEQFVALTVASLAPPKVLAGDVCDDLGHPLANVQVRIPSAPEDSGAVAATDHAGRFELRVPAPGDDEPVALVLSRLDLETVQTGERFAWGRTDLHLTMPHAVGFELLVVDAARQQPVEEYTAWLLPGNGNGGDGREYELRATGHHAGGRTVLTGVRRGAGLVYVEPRAADLAASGFVPVEVGAPGTNGARVVLPASARRQLRVQTPDGAPVADAEVQLEDRLGAPSTLPARVLTIHEWCDAPHPKALLLATATTGADGTTTLRGAAGRTFAVQLRGRGFAPLLLPDVSLDLPEPLVVTVHRGATLRAHLAPEGAFAMLRRQAGLPADGPLGAEATDRLPHLRLWRRDGAAVQSFPDDQHQAKVDADGVFLLDGVPAGRWNVEVVCYCESQVRLGAMRMATSQAEPAGTVDLRDGERTDFAVDLSAMLPGTLAALVLHNGAPLRETNLALVPLGAAGAGSVPVRTDSAGLLHTPLRRGDYRLHWNQGSRGGLLSLETATVSTGQDTQSTFNLQSAPVRIRLLDAQGQPAAGVILELRDAAGTARRWLPPSGADGLTQDEVPLEPFTVWTLPRRLQGAEARMQWQQQHPGVADPFATLRLRLGEVTPRAGAKIETSLQLPDAFAR